VDLKPLLIPASALNEKAGVIKRMEQDHLLEKALDNELIKQVRVCGGVLVPVRVDMGGWVWVVCMARAVEPID
jgi:hypothetical protein